MSPPADPKKVQMIKAGLQAASRRSSLYLWMMENRAEFEEALRQIKPPDWKAVVAWLAQMGLADATGKAPSVERAQQTWWKVRRDAKTHPVSAKAPWQGFGRLSPSADPVVPDKRPDETAEEAYERRRLTQILEQKNRSK